ncbi:MAG: N-acetyl-gamma-glutamyl-phosphate reductase [Atribacterota bacterium]|nr:N-acetyl-gamma-glutamyl-phosphate reductase [Atribacterota bacterium]
MKKIKVSIIGATGYSGRELIKILLKNPQVELTNLVSASYAGKNINEIFPEFLHQLDKNLIELDIDKISADSDVVFTALPHTVSLDIVTDLSNRKELKIIDLSADFRIKDPDNYAFWYKKEHTEKSKSVLKKAVYGLPELYKDIIIKSSLVANPGCYPTSVILGIAPLLKNKLVSPKGIIVDSKSGTSGAGRKLALGLHFTECNENFKAYKCTMHNHISEIEQELFYLYGMSEDIKISFTPHLLPINRGILSTSYLEMEKNVNENDLWEIYKEFYQDAPFVRIFNPSILPEIKFVNETNYCDIGFAVDSRVNKIKIISAIDNLVKGASGQAVQNMNLMFGFPEESGLV